MIMWKTPAGVQKKSPERYKDLSERPDDFRILERVPLDHTNTPVAFSKPHKDDITVVTIDCETTGLGRNDDVIELGMARCRYNRAGELAGVDEKLDMLEDPGKPISPFITKLTGITDDMVSGHHIDGDRVCDMLRDDPLIVAHNARFDRPKFERLFPSDCRWACTMVGIPWVDLGHFSFGLDVILQREGWFYKAHSAINDCLAIAWLLHVVPGSLHTLLAPTVKIMAFDIPYEAKNALKERGYRWDPDKKYWWILRRTQDGDDELAYLERFNTDNVLIHKRNLHPRTEFR